MRLLQEENQEVPVIEQGLGSACVCKLARSRAGQLTHLSLGIQAGGIHMALLYFQPSPERQHLTSPTPLNIFAYCDPLWKGKGQRWKNCLFFW